MWNWLFTHSPLLYFTQSLWRDEAFSILVAQGPVSFILQNFTFEPPVYYMLLHYWIKLFGTGELAARSLSFLGFALAVAIVIRWSEVLFRKHWLSWFTPVLFFFNPMLLYYAFEIRTYGWYTLFSVLSLFAYHQARWRLFALATVLGFYTHTYSVFLFLALAAHWAITHRKKLVHPKKLLRESFVKYAIAAAAAILPWIIRIVRAAGMLKESWYFPVDLHLIRSVLGNMYLGYEGTPWHLWGFTANLSLILLVLFVFAMRKKSTRGTNSLFLSAVFVPLALVIGVSFIKPLFVNRYLISVTVAEVLLVALAIDGIKNRLFQKLCALCAILFVLGFNVWYPSRHAKVDIRSALQEINALKAKDDVVLAETPLVFFETLYYADDPSRVFLYNPYLRPFPWFVGSVIFSKQHMVTQIPLYPTRGFLVGEDGTFTVVYRVAMSAGGSGL